MTLKQHSAESALETGFTPTGDLFVDSCFSFEITSKKETRRPSEIELLKNVPGLIKQKEFRAAWRLLEKAGEKYPDFDFIYIWQAFICQKSGQPKEAGVLLEKGLKQARQKHLLCDRMGFLFFETGDMKNAVQWWIRSITLMQTGGHRQIWEPFLYLSYVAKACGSEPLFEQFSEMVARICRQGELKFEEKTEKDIFEKAEQLPKDSILKALEISAGMFKSDTGQDPSPEKEIPVMTAPGIGRFRFHIIIAGLIIIALAAYLLISPDEPDQIPPAPYKPVATETGDQATAPQEPAGPSLNSAPDSSPGPTQEIEVKPAEIRPAETAAKSLSEKTGNEIAAPEKEPLPHKEKLRQLKVKTKTAHPGVLKKTE